MRKLIGIASASLVSLLILLCFSCSSQPPNQTSQSVIGSMQIDIATLKSSVTALNSAVTSLQSIPAGASKAQIDNLTAELNSNISKVNTLQSQLNNLDSKVNAIQSPTLTGYAKQTAVDDLRAQVSVLATRTAGATGEPPPLTQIATIQSDIAGLKTQLATIQANLNDAQAKIVALQAKDVLIEARIAALETRLPSTGVPVVDKVEIVEADDGELSATVRVSGTYTVIVTMYGVNDLANITLNGSGEIAAYMLSDSHLVYDPYYSIGRIGFTYGSDKVYGTKTGVYATKWTEDNTENGGFIRLNGTYYSIQSFDYAEQIITLDNRYLGSPILGAVSYDLATAEPTNNRIVIALVTKTWTANESFAILVEGFEIDTATATIGVG